jgi:hypothetical protein
LLEAINDWARGGCAGAKSSRAPTGVRGKRSEASERFYLPEAINDWASGGCAGAKSSRAPTGVRGKRSEARERV